MTPTTVGLIGAGGMATALARGWRRPLLCTDAGSGRARALAAEVGGEAVADNRALAERADVVVLCHEPHALANVAREVDGRAGLVVSVLSGVTRARLRECYPRTPVLRFAVNLPVEVRQGVVCCPREQPTDDGPLQAAAAGLFAELGTYVRLPEASIPALITLTGVGPAYAALFLEAQVEAAVLRGIPPEQAGRLATQVMAGTAALLESRGHDTLALRRAVTSPGGATARGIAALERSGLRAAVFAASDAVAGALGGPPDAGVKSAHTTQGEESDGGYAQDGDR